jgi:hypothetical protein
VVALLLHTLRKLRLHLRIIMDNLCISGAILDYSEYKSDMYVLKWLDVFLVTFINKHEFLNYVLHDLLKAFTFKT